MVQADRPTSPGGQSSSAVSISVFFPCYNEQANVARVAKQAVRVLEGLGADYEIIIVDDGSADETGRIADEIAAGNDRVRVVHHERNLGYGAALQSGFRAARKELVFYTDGDGQFDIGEMPALLPLMNDYDIVSCYRMNRRDNVVRKINGWLWTKVTGLVFSLKVRDVDCAFKLYRRSIFDRIKMESTGALIDTEILARAARKGYTITQRGVHHYPRTAGRQTGASLRVILRAFRELWQLRRRIVREP
ncbi:MAG: glycosyltransferase family 2 protein [Sedimentisphaerales bacterium]|jgi:glycosyltransferase involved in cell wall biosynthesis|nr:glycosyltransferase family 2 protein [Sedimentisphaerales bacterium]HNY78871.1 glycosyltransferase family 2 protein [Sedimentisphaerales bacterium]HOC63028.1 glycosyltransferase family 2 protein [Sedimentisphaerales bacterium]HOH64755.1 glycosyltransferase family 2 protein [Sedimentisphaerales bacterium]HPY49400.1 glycosyltransferase family 2 protein [Sedimentisphaerales bacterium]